MRCYNYLIRLCCWRRLKIWEQIQFYDEKYFKKYERLCTVSFYFIWKKLLMYKTFPSLLDKSISRSELTHFSPLSHFYDPWKRQTTKGFLTFSGGIEMWHWSKMGYCYPCLLLNWCQIHVWSLLHLLHHLVLTPFFNSNLDSEILL